MLSDNSSRPSSLLHTALSALSHVYNSTGAEDITKHVSISRLVTALIKSHTFNPRKASKVMPTEAFKKLFMSWEENDRLTIKQLRLKALSLLALTAMLRPSDVAPKGKVFDEQTEQCSDILFTTDMLMFLPEGVKITFFGIKNDTQRTGFEILLPAHKDKRVDPVEALKCYIQRTESLRTDKAVFLSLNKPYKAITAAAVGKILEEAIGLAGLSGQGYTAKSFRPTGATLAIDRGVEPKIVQKLGRWKCTDVFFEHYVHSRTPPDYVSKLV